MVSSGTLNDTYNLVDAGDLRLKNSDGVSDGRLLVHLWGSSECSAGHLGHVLGLT
jgi:hypothetical protein